MSGERTNLIEPKKPRNYGGNQSIPQPTTNGSLETMRIPIPTTNYSISNLSSYDDDSQMNWMSSLWRSRYYYRLGVPNIPDHIVPDRFFVLLPTQTSVPGSQSSLVTIFSIWNTMMGTSILSMPWVIREAGFGLSIILIILVATLAFYTAYLVLSSTENLPLEAGRSRYTADFTDACRYYLGRTGEVTALIFSFLALLGALIVYYVLLCNFLYSTLHNIYNFATNQVGVIHTVVLFNHNYTDVICKSMRPYPTHNVSFAAVLSLPPLHLNPVHINTSSIPTFNRLWSQTKTVPFWLLIVIFPLISIKSPSFFTKFNAFGTLSIFYLILLVIWKSIKWGIHMDFQSTDYHTMVPNARITFTFLTGVCSLAFFIHNAIHSIVRNQAVPSNNIRDLFIAYVCVTITYLGVGLAFYMSFPFAKDCIEENFLNNIPNTDVLAFIGRVALFVQMLSVLPLLMYILRTQFMYFFFKKLYPSWIHVFFLHLALVTICVLFAVFMPSIGQIIRFSGAVCGLFYIFMLPSLVKLKSLAKESKLTLISLVFFIFLIALGVLNFLGQFLPYII